MRRLLLLAVMLLAWAMPARADDISAAGRGVVRIVTIAVIDDEVVGFGHGSGFAVAPDMVVTNAHVVELADRYPGNVVVGVVPSEGDRSYQGQVVALDKQRDLALIRFTGVRLPPLTLYNGPLDDGAAVVALGYPGNVDLATARSAVDFIKPMTAVRSQGVYSGMRSMEGTTVLLHNASVARGNSGGPLLDPCGRVLGVNSAITRADEGDSTFAFAIAGSELTAFLTAAKVPPAIVSFPCTSLADQMEQERSADARARAEAEDARRAAAAKAESDRQLAVAEAQARNETMRENFMAGAAVLLVLGALAIGGAGLLESRGRRDPAIWAAVGGGLLILGSILLFLLRPQFDASRILPVPAASPPAAATGGFGPMMCTIVPERSRVTVSDTRPVALDVTPDGCVNGRTQYVERGTGWERILVPEEEQTVSVLNFDPATRTYTNTRFQLSASAMATARQLRGQVELKACTSDANARAVFASQQSQIRTALPQTYNEKLVYHCAPAARAGTPAPAGN